MTAVSRGRSTRVRDCVATMHPYAPPEDPERLAHRLGIPVDQVVKLDANENPYGPSPRVYEALAKFRSYHIYADADQEAPRKILAPFVQMPPGHLILGNGSDEMIDLLMRAYLDPGDEVLEFSPTFGEYAFVSQQYDARLIQVPRDERFDVDVEAGVRAITDRTRLAFVAAPNNPTGNPVDPSVVERLLETGIVVVLDEAYAEFTGESLASWVPNYENLVILRTFSKWAGLAGQRLGYAILPLGIAQHIWKLKPPFNINQAAIVAMEASLGDRDWLMGNVHKIIAERERLFHRLSTVPFLRPFPSHANFILCQINGLSGRELSDNLADRGILVRYYDWPRLQGCVRISVGTPENSDRLLEALVAVRPTA